MISSRLSYRDSSSLRISSLSLPSPNLVLSSLSLVFRVSQSPALESPNLGSTNQIKLFVSVAKSQNLAKTARRIHVSPSSVSQRLKSLESEMGAKLYQKCKEGIKLTDAGRVLLETANEILTRIETVKKPSILVRRPKSSRWWWAVRQILQRDIFHQP